MNPLGGSSCFQPSVKLIGSSSACQRSMAFTLLKLVSRDGSINAADTKLPRFLSSPRDSIFDTFQATFSSMPLPSGHSHQKMSSSDPTMREFNNKIEFYQPYLKRKRERESSVTCRLMPLILCSTGGSCLCIHQASFLLSTGRDFGIILPLSLSLSLSQC